jgi:dipicolinate synthase subunit B
MRLDGKTIGWGFSGSHHTMPLILPVVGEACRRGARVLPVLSATLASTTTRHGRPEDWIVALEEITGCTPLTQIPEVEPFGPGRTCDVVVLAPCTGNSLARLANAITDSAPLMACKSQLRNRRPVVVAVSTNDGLGLNAKNLAVLLNTRDVYLVPFGQDNPTAKPNSLASHLDLLLETVECALDGRQLQPVLRPW